MLINGYNPFLFVPEYFINHQLYPIANAQLLYDGMGLLNGSHYSNYPPINQLNFAFAAVFGSNSITLNIIFLRLQIILADIGIIYFGAKILKFLGQNQNKIFLYALNPLVIIELTGNLHFEAVMLFFLITSFYFLLTNKIILSALLFGFSIATKLIPILFLPLLLYCIGIQK
ncbi:MAG: hypothetical protein HC798_02800 [Polaribacter sp.]|nr:hypothetical protein [Polaribacter sp.]